MRIDAVVAPPRKSDRLSRLYPAGLILEQLLDEGIAAPVIISRVLLAEPPSRWKSFGASSSLLLVLLLSVFLLPLLFPDRFEPVRHYLAIALAKPAEVPPKFAIRRVAVPPRAQIVPAAPVETGEMASVPKIYMPAAEPMARPITSHKSQPAPLIVEVASAIESPPPVPAASLEIPSLTKPREGVHTGIFGANDESGSSNSGNESRGRSRVVNVGFSNGTGGFADGNGRGLVQGAFADGHPKSEPKPGKESAPPVPVTAVKILAKPTPLYTSEARSKKVEGEVVLKVIFQATGNVQVLTVVRGLGFGLDESAENAARRIQFEPAKQDGQPVDFAAVVHINFQLAE
jgi:TonB family protein